MTQSEQRILDWVKQASKHNHLAGLATSPNDSNWSDKKNRFVRRLHEAGKIVWITWGCKYGAGWCLPEYAEKFREGNK